MAQGNLYSLFISWCSPMLEALEPDSSLQFGVYYFLCWHFSRLTLPSSLGIGEWGFIYTRALTIDKWKHLRFQESEQKVSLEFALRFLLSALPQIHCALFSFSILYLVLPTIKLNNYANLLSPNHSANFLKLALKVYFSIKFWR